MARNQHKVGENKSDVVRELPLACTDEQAAVEFFEKHRWHGEPCCPRCGDTDVYIMRSRDGGRNKDFRWRCRGCKRTYTVRTGTVMEDSRIPFRFWAFAFWRATSSKKGVSALEIQRQTGLTYKSALFLMHRIRHAMDQGPSAGKLGGTVEADETFVGGKPRYRGPHNPRGTAGKQPVMAAVERGGSVKTRVIPDVTAKTLKPALREMVDRGARVMTDDNASYRGVGDDFPGGHHVVNHSAKQYVDGEVHTNTIEGYFSIVKRGLHGIWHNVSRKHLHRYLAASEFRYNHRHLDDGERAIAAIRAAVGKRLTYADPSPKADAG